MGSRAEIVAEADAREPLIVQAAGYLVGNPAAHLQILKAVSVDADPELVFDSGTDAAELEPYARLAAKLTGPENASQN